MISRILQIEFLAEIRTHFFCCEVANCTKKWVDHSFTSARLGAGVISSVLDSYNGCLLAYGHTGPERHIPSSCRRRNAVLVIVPLSNYFEWLNNYPSLYDRQCFYALDLERGVK